MTGALAEDGDLRFVAEQASGAIDSPQFTRLEILGLSGAVSVRAGRPGDLRYACKDLSTRREERPVVLWSGEQALVLAPASGKEADRVLCEVVLPPHFADLVVEMNDSKVVLNGLPGRSAIRGSGIDLDARAMAGSLDARIEGGSARITGAVGAVRIEGNALQVSVTDADSTVSLVLTNGRAQMSKIGGDVTVDLEATNITADSVEGRLEASVSAGTLVLSALRGGGDFRLSDAPLQLSLAKGDYDVDTDAEVQARDLQGDLKVRSDGTRIAVVGSTGQLIVDGTDCEVVAEKIAGRTQITGDGLKLQFRELLGELAVRVASSQVAAASVAGNVSIENDFGDIVLAQAAKAVTIGSLQGTVKVTQLGGPLQLRADGPDVLVHWAGALSDDSSIENQGGTVTVMFSGDSGGRVVAESRRGEVQSSINGVAVGEGGSSAEGHVNRLPSPTIRIVADGDLTLSAGVPAAGG